MIATFFLCCKCLDNNLLYLYKKFCARGADVPMCFSTKECFHFLENSTTGNLLEHFISTLCTAIFSIPSFLVLCPWVICSLMFLTLLLLSVTVLYKGLQRTIRYLGTGALALWDYNFSVWGEVPCPPAERLLLQLSMNLLTYVTVILMFITFT